MWPVTRTHVGRITLLNILKCVVENRVKEIRQCNANFRYVSTEFNPADIASRGSTPDQLQKSNLWWFGPSFLSQDENLWPKNQIKKSKTFITYERKRVKLREKCEQNEK